MKFICSVSLLLSLASFSFAQDLSAIPTCAQGAVIGSISSTGCQLSDIACICKNTAFLNSLLPAIQKACSADDFAKTETVAQQLCLSASVTITIPGASATGVPASTPAASGSATDTASGSATPSATGSSAPQSSGSASSTPSGSSTVAPSSTSTIVSSPASGASGLQVLNGAGSSMIVGVMGLIAGGLLML